LNKLAEKQKELSKKNDDENTSEKQKDIENKFSEVKKDLEEVKKITRSYNGQ